MKQNFTFLVFLSYVVVSSAQVKLSLPQILAYKNDIVPVYVSITTSDSISTLQFSLNWDAKVLSFISVDSLILPLSNGENFGTNNASNGICTFLWIAPGKAYIFPTVTKLFKLTFRVIGDGGSNASIQFSDTPTKIASKNAQNSSLTITKNDGVSTVATRVATAEVNVENNFTLGQNYPNPTNGYLNIPIEVKNPSEYTLTINNLLGEAQVSEKNKLLVGKTTWRLPFVSSGLFVYTLCNVEGVCASKKFLSD